ncbi:MAG: hypothetical protein RBU29_12245 [bacterium]|nr:hypothetical protein [bacterium]
MVSGKKAALIGCAGCAGIVALVVILLAGGVGVVIYQGVQIQKEMHQTYRDLALRYLDLNQAYPFTPPASSQLTPQQAEKVMSIRTALSATLQDNIDNLGNLGETVGQSFEEPGLSAKWRGFTQIKELVGQAMSFGVAVGEEHLRLLESSQMSPAEYQWLVKTVLGTLAHADPETSPDAAAAWTAYMERFEQVSHENQNIQMDFGQTHLRGSDMNPQNLKAVLAEVPFLKENQESLNPFLSQLMANETLPLLDFLSLNLDRLINQLAR